MKQGPDLYLEPKWLWYWHYLRCTLDSKMLVQIPCSWPIIKTTLFLRGSKCLQLAQSAQLPRMDLLDATTMPCVCSVAGHLSDLPRIYILSKCIATKYFEKIRSEPEPRSQIHLKLPGHVLLLLKKHSASGSSFLLSSKDQESLNLLDATIRCFELLLCHV